MNKVKKRNGKIVDYDDHKIFEAIRKANKDSKDPKMKITEIYDLVKQVEERLKDVNTPNVERIQDNVEHVLMNSAHESTAKHYIIYRAEHAKARDASADLMNKLMDLTYKSADEMESRRDNANINTDSSMGTMLKYGTETSNYFNDNFIIPKKFVEAHREGRIHIHDKDFLTITFNCMPVDTPLIIKHENNIKHTDFNEFVDLFKTDRQEWINISDKNYEIVSKDGFTKIKYVMRKKEEYKLYTFILNDGREIKATSEHIMVLKNGRELYAAKVALYDELMVTDYSLSLPEDIDLINSNKGLDGSIKEIRITKFHGWVYDFETENHLFDVNGIIVHNCCQVDIIKLFKDGFNTGHGFLREPNSIRAASSLACIAIQSNQNEMFGGQSIPNFDYAMAIYARKTFQKAFKKHYIRFYSKEDYEKNKDELLKYSYQEEKDRDEYTKNMKLLIKQSFTFACEDLEEETKQSMEAVIHNFNTLHSRAGAQVPFSSINYGTDTSPEGRLVIREILLAHERGLGHGETPIFPIAIFKLKTGLNFNPEDKSYDLFKLACRVSAKRLFPNFENIDAPYNLQYYDPNDYRTEIATMGCRTRTISNQYDKTRNFTASRGNFSFTTINLPKIALDTRDKDGKSNIKKFYKRLKETMDLCRDQLLWRFNLIGKKHAYNYPFLMGQGVWIDSDKLKPEDTIQEVIKHASLSIGFCGLAECLVALIGKHHGESEEAQKLGLEIIGYMRNITDKYAEESNLSFSLFATPAESTAGRFVKLTRTQYGKIKGVTDRDYFTNSNHVPVYYPISAFKKVDIEAPYHELCNAGHIIYIELDGDPSNNLEAFEELVRYMHTKQCGYLALNHQVDRCVKCGYTGIINDKCPACGYEDHYKNQLLKINLKELI